MVKTRLNVIIPSHLTAYNSALNLMTARVLNNDYDFYYEVADKLFLVEHIGNNFINIHEILPPKNYNELKAYNK